VHHARFCEYGVRERVAGSVGYDTFVDVIISERIVTRMSHHFRPLSALHRLRRSHTTYERARHVLVSISPLSEKVDRGKLNFMSELWFPGRPPMCSDQILPLFTRYFETLLDLGESKNGTALELLENIQDDALMYIEGENATCLNTDPILTKLKEMLINTTEAARLAYLHQAWSEILTLAISTSLVCQELAEALERVTV